MSCVNYKGENHKDVAKKKSYKTIILRTADSTSPAGSSCFLQAQNHKYMYKITGHPIAC